MNWRRFVGPIAGLIISLGLLALLLYRVDLVSVAAAFRAADYRLVLLAGVLTTLSYVFRTLRWARLLRPQKRIPLNRLFPVLVLGFALNNVLPGRPGEIARAVGLGQRESLPKTAGLATVIVERVADGLTLITILAVIALGFDIPGWGREVEGISIAVFVVVLVVLLLLLWRERLAMRLLHRLIHLVPIGIGQRITRMLASFILGLHSLRSLRDILSIVVVSCLVWLSEGAHYFLILSAFGWFPGIPQRLLASCFVMVIVNLSISIPAAPGGVGPFEAAGILALSAFGLAREQSLPALLLSHALQYVLVTGLGILFVVRTGLGLSAGSEKSALREIRD